MRGFFVKDGLVVSFGENLRSTRSLQRRRRERRNAVTTAP